MSDNNQPENQPGTPDEELGEAGLKALQKEREARQKERDARKALEKQLEELKPLADQWQQAEEARKSELDRMKETAAKAESDAAAARTEALRYRIASKHGISEEDAEVFLTGSDEESLSKQAERLVALQGERVAVQQQKPDPSQGARPSAPKDAWSSGKARAQARYGTPG